MKSLFLLALLSFWTLSTWAATPEELAAEEQRLIKVVAAQEQALNQAIALAAEKQRLAQAAVVEKAQILAQRQAQAEREDQARRAVAQQADHERQVQFAAAQQADRERQAQLAASARAEAEYQVRLAAWQQQQSAAAYAAAQTSVSPYTSASSYQRSLDAQAGIYAPPAQSQAPFRPYPQAGGAPGFDLLNTVDFHFSPGGAWLHGSNGQTYRVTPIPGGGLRLER